MVQKDPIILIVRDRQQWKRGQLLRYSSPVRSRERRHRTEQLEQLESRFLFSAAPIEFGAVYTEQDLGSDAHDDIIEISFAGGAPGTQLHRVEIDGDKRSDGLSLADILFDTAQGGIGADLFYSEIISRRVGEFNAQILVEDGSSQLVLLLENFEAGDKLVLSIDVDEVQSFEVDPNDLAALNDELDPVTSGAEFQQSRLRGEFTAPHFHDLSLPAEFRNRYDEALDATHLDLPRDDERNNRDRTAGAVGTAAQEPLPIGISGRVYEDHNANLVRDPQDQGIPRVPLTLFILQGNTYVTTSFTTQTDAQGAYQFPASLGLLPGTYQVRETQPENYYSVGVNVGFVEGQTSGSAVDNNKDVLTQIEIPLGGQFGTEYNFAEARLGTLSGTVQLSTREGDCFTESVFHQPVVGAVVRLLNDQGIEIDSTTTNGQGNYQFAALPPGKYTIVEETPVGLIDGGVQVGEIDGESRGTAGTDRVSQIELFSGETGTNYDFCEHQPTALSGHVFHDRDDDGQREPATEEGIADVLLSLLDEVGTTVATVRTGPQGAYEFTGLRSGNYRLVELHPAHWIDGQDRPGTIGGISTGSATNPGDQISEIELLWGDQGIDYDFGELKPASLQGRVHLSTPEGDCFGVTDELLEPVVGAIVQLLDTTGKVLAEATTDQNGNYLFENLAPGDYSLREITPEGLVDGGAQAGTVHRVEGPITRGTVASASEIRHIQLGSDESGVDYDFCEHPPASIGGFVFADDSGDGGRDVGEAGLAGVRIELYDGAGNLIAHTLTAADGSYRFSGLEPGRYSIREIHPAGWLDGLDATGTVLGEPRGVATNPGDELKQIDLLWGDVGIEYNFGELLPGTLEGSIHSSPSEDCWNDPTALPLVGVRVWLLDADGNTLAETRTNERGEYRFDGLPPGEYQVREEQPATQFQGGTRAGTGGGDTSIVDWITQIRIHAGELVARYDFCELPPSRLSGYVFQDGPPVELLQGETLPEDLSEIRSGERTADDLPLAGVTLELRDGINGLPILSESALPGIYPDGPIRTVTNAQGYYEFTGIPKGNYGVYEIHPVPYLDGIDTPGSTDGIAINPIPAGEDSIAIETVVSSLVDPPRNDAIVRIALPTGIHSESNNFSEVIVNFRTPPEEPPNPPFYNFPPSAPIPPATELVLPELMARERLLPPLPSPDIVRPFEGSTGVRGNTWHLSIIDGGSPRMARLDDPASLLFPASVWHTQNLATGRWRIDTSTESDRKRQFEAETSEVLTDPISGMTEVSHYFGVPGGTPVSGDFDGDGTSEMGMFFQGHWFLDINGNGRWDNKDLWAKLGHAGDLPVTGDWDGDGKDDIGIFGKAWPGDPRAVEKEPGLPDFDNVAAGEPKNMPPKDQDASLGRRLMKLSSKGGLRSDLIDHVFLYGSAGDAAVAGDWNGDGIDTVGVFRNGNWKLDVDGNGRFTSADENCFFGQQGDIPLVGDFNGDGIDDIAIYRNGRLIMDSNRNRQLDSSDLQIRVEHPQGIPVAGKWTGEAADSIAWYDEKEVGETIVAQNRDIAPQTK